MKLVFTLILCSVIAVNAYAQRDTSEVKVLKKNVVTVVEDGQKTHVKVGENKGVEVITDEWGDTTHIRIGRRTFDVVEGENSTHVSVGKEPREKHWSGNFNPHWAGLEFGLNMFHETDYSQYLGTEYFQYGDFFDLNQGKSITVNLNIFEWAFTNEGNNFGLVTGVGFSFMDFTFDQPLTIDKNFDLNMIVPKALDPEGLKKSKLNLTYLTVPLMLEVKTPLRMGGSRLYLAGGVIGGLNIGSHTKFKYKNDKEKDKSNFYLNTFKYDVTGRIGFGDLCVFVNYTMTPMFEEAHGPKLYPVTFGISFPNI